MTIEFKPVVTTPSTKIGRSDRDLGNRAEEIVYGRVERVWRSKPYPAGKVRVPGKGYVLVDSCFDVFSGKPNQVDVNITVDARNFKGSDEQALSAVVEQAFAEPLRQAREELDDSGLECFSINLCVSVVKTGSYEMHTAGSIAQQLGW